MPANVPSFQHLLTKVLCRGECMDISIARRRTASVSDEKTEPENSYILAHAFSLKGTVKS